MTTVDILYRYDIPPSGSVSLALAAVRDVYGIRHLRLDQATRTVRIEFDATRLTAAAVTGIVRLTGLDIVEELPLIPPAPVPQPAPAA